MILATFRAGLYVYHIHEVQNYVFAEVINKKTLHNHVFTKVGGEATLHNHVFSDDEVEREFTITYLQNSEVEPLRRDVIQKYVILATFRAVLYVYHIHGVQNYVFAEVINKKTLHNHVFTEFGGGAVNCTPCQGHLRFFYPTLRHPHFNHPFLSTSLFLRSLKLDSGF